MKDIGEEIKTKNFQSVYQKVMVNIIYTGNAFNHAASKVFKQFGLSPQQYNILRILKGQYPKPASINLLTERMLDKSSNASRLVDKLVLKNLAERTESTEDRRRVDVIITKKGIDLLPLVGAKAQTIEKSLQNLSIQEIENLNDLLNKIRSLIVD